MKLETTYFFIDAGYLSKISKYFGEGNYLNCDMICFANKIAQDKKLWCKGIFYYTAPPYQSPSPTDSEKERRRNYDKFVSTMQKRHPEFIVREGRCQKGLNDDYHQKGVDTNITMDLLRIAQSRKVKKIIFLACDTDFVPILNEIRNEFKIEVILVYYTDRKRNSAFSMSNYILTACDDKILLNKEHFDRCLRK